MTVVEAHSVKGVPRRRLSFLKCLTQHREPLRVRNEDLCEGDWVSPKIYLHIPVLGSGLGKTRSSFRGWRAR